MPAIDRPTAVDRPTIERSAAAAHPFRRRRRDRGLTASRARSATADRRTLPWLCGAALAAVLAAPPAAGQVAPTPERDSPPAATAVPPLAAGEPLAPVRVARAAGPIVVDGRLDETAWEAAAAVAVPFEWFPGDNTAAPVETHVRVAFDDERLYVGFRARDPRPAAIRAHLADRDDAFQDDSVAFAIDPFNDRRTAYLFRVNPLGVQMDARLSDVEDSEDGRGTRSGTRRRA
jgi:hypothetical protein